MIADIELRDALVSEWHDWRSREIGTGGRATVAEAVRFCAYLARRKSRLLDLCPGGDPWRHVQSVLLEAGAIAAIDPRNPL
jgi:hypothetical protein